MAADNVLELPDGKRIFYYNLTPDEIGDMYDSVVDFLADREADNGP